MTKQQPIQADTIIAVIRQIPLEMLYISDLNPRKAVSEAHIESLGDSIERFDLTHNHAGLVDEDGKVGIVAGGRRFRAVQQIAERSKTHHFTTVPVKLAADAAEAEDWASAENAARLRRHRGQRERGKDLSMSRHRWCRTFPMEHDPGPCPSPLRCAAGALDA